MASLLQGLQNSGLLTDANPGSVVRTLAEAFALELAEAHAKLGVIYDMGFIDTATGDSLDHLVALLGQKRIDSRLVMGEAVFERDARIRGRIVIPESTELLIKKAGGTEVLYRTVQEAEMQAGQSVVTVPIAADVPSGASADAVILNAEDVGNATQVSVLAGIGSVVVSRPTTSRGNSRESDEALRARLKGLVQSAGGGTYKALERAILATGKVGSVVFRDAGSGGVPELQPGELEVAVDVIEGDLSNAATYAAIVAAIDQAKGPGILVSLKGTKDTEVALRLTLKLSTANLPLEKREAIRAAAERAVTDAIGQLPVGQKLLWNPLLAKILSVDGVLDIAACEFLIGGASVTPDDPPRGEFPKAGIDPLERLVLAKQGQAIAIAFEGESSVLVRPIFDFRPSEPASSRPDAGLRASIARTVENKLKAINATNGKRTLLWKDIADAARDVAGAKALLQGRALRVQVVSVRGGGETLLEEGGSYYLGADDVLNPDPAGPLWGDEA